MACVLLLSVKKIPNILPSFPVLLCDLLFHHMVILRIETSNQSL